MDDLVTFLRARLDEDEEIAKAATTKRRWNAGTESFDEDSGGNLIGDGRASVNDGDALGARPIVVMHEEWHYPPHAYQLVEHIARHDPARVLRDVEAKRRIVGLLDDFAEVRDDYPWTTGEILRHLAAVYSDNPSFREEWKP